jgi:hypothetical protein
VVKDDEEGLYYLESSELGSRFSEPDRMIEYADGVLTRLMGAAKLAGNDLQPVHLSGRFDRPKPAECSDVSICVNDSAVARDRLTVVRLGTIEARGRSTPLPSTRTETVRASS